MIPIMPEEFKGEEMKTTEYIKTIPRKWTKEEIEWCLDLKEKGYTAKEIAFSIGREYVSTNIKLKRLTKKDNTYNKAHIIEKYSVNQDFFNEIKPKSILDVYCGVSSYWKSNYGENSKVVTNDKDESITADYHMDSLKFLCKNYVENNKFDIIDLDPFGSASNCFELAIQMAKKGLIITLGEMGHKRFKRLDFVKRHYGISSLDDFTSENIIEEIKKVGAKYKKELKVFKKCDWKGISRVWFLIDDIKITEQWEQN